MIFDTAVRLTEILIGLVFIQQSLEHLVSQPNMRYLFVPRLILSILLIFDWNWALYGLLILSVGILHRFQGPYNGGSDRMGLLILICLCLISIMPNQYWREI
ncbi:MAG: HTTM domain-containing protein, partial [Pseudomonadota bacterium]